MLTGSSSSSGRPQFHVSQTYGGEGETHGAIAVGYDSRERRILWTATDQDQEGIMFVREKEDKEEDDEEEEAEPEYLIRGGGIHLSEGLAVDYLGRNVYFTDTHADTDGDSFVGVASMDKKDPWAKVISQSRYLHKPRGDKIVEDPLQGTKRGV